jgi:FkbM family methyltransferase
MRESSNSITVPQLIEILKGQNDEIERLNSIVKSLACSFPDFYRLSQAKHSFIENQLYTIFYSFLLGHLELSKSQLFQDLFAQFVCMDLDKPIFIEFGATDGMKRSNTCVLESVFGWRGVLAEPDTQWHESLYKNRPDSIICNDCVYSRTGEMVDFFSSSEGELSTIEKYVTHDEASMPGNTAARMRGRATYPVTTISLNDLISRHIVGRVPNYISIDTEGSELEILRAFDFEKYGPDVFTVEHNFTRAEGELDALMDLNGYTRIFKAHTQFDGWYVKNSSLDALLKRLQIH